MLFQNGEEHMKLLLHIWFNFIIFWRNLIALNSDDCISSIEERLSEISDDEYFVAQTMQDGGIDCELIFTTLLVSRRKISFIRKMNKLGIKGVNLEHLVKTYMNELRGNAKIDDLVSRANQEYIDAKTKRVESPKL